jgi:PIN domain nuclease of toxin-antitoxin system
MNKLLLDTHTFIWLDSYPEKLSPAALTVCEDPCNKLYLSVVSVWEMMIKIHRQRLTLRIPLREMIQGQQEMNGVKLLPVELPHVYALEALSLNHNDPFDRLLVAQAIAEQMALVSADSKLTSYPVEIIW